MSYKHFTPDISDIRVGYECEKRLFTEYDTEVCCPPNCSESYNLQDKVGWIWEKYFLTKKDIIDLLEYEGDLRTGKGIPVSGFFRTPYLTKEQIESCGFTLKHKSIDYWFEINEDKRFDTNLQDFCGYKAYNIFLNYGFHDYRLKIKVDFSGGGNFDRAETLYDGECKCINQLRQILKQIHITPFYAP